MTSLDWNLLAEKFYTFKGVADKFGFYVPELQGMEKSLELMRPYAGDNEKAKELADKKNMPQVIDPPTWLTQKAEAPMFDDEDALIKA